MSDLSDSEVSDILYPSPDSSDVEDHDVEDAGRAQIVVRGAQPYQFEPLPRERNEDEDDNDDDDEEIDYNQRIDNIDWYLYYFFLISKLK